MYQSQNSNNFPMLTLINEFLPSPLPILSPLQPDRPASSYQLSYTKFHQQKISSRLSNVQTSQLLAQIQQLNKQLSTIQNQHAQQKSKYHEQLLLMSIQVQRVRTIMNQQGQTLQRMKNQWNSLQSVYVLKFQQLKLQLNREWQSQINNKTQQTKQTIQQVRQLYIQKINILTHQYEQKLKQQQQQIFSSKHQNTTLQIYQLNKQQLQNKLKSYIKINQGLEKQNFKLKQQLYIQNNQNKKDLSQKQDKQKIYKQRNQQLTKINRQLIEQINRIKEQIGENKSFIENNVEKLERQKKISQDIIDKLKYKNHKLQQQLQVIRLQAHKIQQQTNILEQENDKLQMQKQRLGQQILKLESELQVFKNRKTQQQINMNSGTQTLVTGKKLLLNNTMRNQPLNRPYSPNHNINIKPPYMIQSSPSIQHAFPYEHQYSGNHSIQNLNNQNEKNQKNNQIRRQTQERISLQQSLKRMHDLQAKVQQLNAQIQRREQIIYSKDNQIDQKKLQIKLFKKKIAQNENQLKSLSTAVIGNKEIIGEKKKKTQINEVNNNNQSDMLIVQKQNQIEELNAQISNYIKKIQKLQKKLEKSKQTQLKLTKQLQEIQEKLKNNQISLDKFTIQNEQKIQQFRQLIEQIKKKDQQLKQSDSGIKQKDQIIKQLELNIKQRDNEIKQKQRVIREKQDEIAQKDSQIKLLINQNKEKHNAHNEKKKGTKRQRQNRNAMYQSVFADPFAQPLVIQQQDNQIMSVNHDQDGNIFHGQEINPIQRLKKYSQKIQLLQNVVKTLNFQWGQTQQYQGAIFRQIQATYTDQIKLLTQKSNSNLEIVQGLSKMLQQQSKKNQALRKNNKN